MVPKDFSTRSRDDRKEFDVIRTECFKQTETEKEEQEKENIRIRQWIILQKLIEKKIIIPENITKERMLIVMDWLDAKQFLWEDLEWYIDNQLKLLWTLENVMNNLVLTYL